MVASPIFFFSLNRFCLESRYHTCCCNNSKFFFHFFFAFLDLHLHSTMAPKAKNLAWAHVDVVEGKMFCKKNIKGGGVYRLKHHSVVVLEAKLSHVKLHWM